MWMKAQSCYWQAQEIRRSSWGGTDSLQGAPGSPPLAECDLWGGWSLTGPLWINNTPLIYSFLPFGFLRVISVYFKLTCFGLSWQPPLSKFRLLRDFNFVPDRPSLVQGRVSFWHHRRLDSIVKIKIILSLILRLMFPLQDFRTGLPIKKYLINTQTCKYTAGPELKKNPSCLQQHNITHHIICFLWTLN